MVRNNAHILVCAGAFLTLITPPAIAQANENASLATQSTVAQCGNNEAAKAEAEIFNLLHTCFDSEQDTRPFHVFIEAIITHLQKYKEYFKHRYPTINIDNLIIALQSIKHSDSPNKIGITLKDYKCLLPENLQKLSIFAMRKRIARRLTF